MYDKQKIIPTFLPNCHSDGLHKMTDHFNIPKKQKSEKKINLKLKEKKKKKEKKSTAKSYTKN